MRRVNPNVYTKKYYLTDSTGYQEYLRSSGEELEVRFRRIVKEIPSVKSKKVLDIGCGRGELVLWSVKNGAEFATGIDYSKNAIFLSNKARTKWPKNIKNKTKFILMDAKRLDFKDRYFDAILMTEVFEHLFPEEQAHIMKEISRVLKNGGFVFIHTAPSKWFNNYTYKYWCYPISTILIKLNNLITGNDYKNIAMPKNIRSKSHEIMHVNEPDYFSLRRLFKKHNFTGVIFSTNVTIAKPILGWKDLVFNSLTYFNPLSFYPPFNILWGNDFYVVLRKK